jgi:Domain of unknown function (DUF4124)
MRLFILKLMVYLTLFAGLGNYIVYLTTGRIPLREIWLRYGKLPTSLPTPSLPSVDLPKMPTLPGRNEGHQKAFKWTDGNGIVHYSDQPPDGQDAKLIDMDPDQNLMQGTPPADPPQENTTQEKKTHPKKPAESEIDQINKTYQIDQSKLEAIKQKLLDSQMQRPAID